MQVGALGSPRTRPTAGDCQAAPGPGEGGGSGGRGRGRARGAGEPLGGAAVGRRGRAPRAGDAATERLRRGCRRPPGQAACSGARAVGGRLREALRRLPARPSPRAALWRAAGRGAGGGVFAGDAPGAGRLRLGLLPPPRRLGHVWKRLIVSRQLRPRRCRQAAGRCGQAGEWRERGAVPRGSSARSAGQARPRQDWFFCLLSPVSVNGVYNRLRYLPGRVFKSSADAPPRAEAAVGPRTLRSGAAPSPAGRCLRRSQLLTEVQHWQPTCLPPPAFPRLGNTADAAYGGFGCRSEVAKYLENFPSFQDIPSHVSTASSLCFKLQVTLDRRISRCFLVAVVASVGHTGRASARLSSDWVWGR